jgi:hypothetical protein
MRFAWAMLALSWAALGSAEEAPLGDFKTCFDASADQAGASGPEVPRAEIEKARAAIATARGFRACVSLVSLFQGAKWGTFEYAAPDRRRWRMRRKGRGLDAPVIEVEAVQVGAQAWLRRDGRWSRLAAGRKLQDAAGKEAWLPDPTQILPLFLDSSPGLVKVGSATARSATCDLWSKVARDGPALNETLYVDTRDRRPYRVASGGPGIEAYLQLEIYDYDALVEIQPPR